MTDVREQLGEFSSMVDACLSELIPKADERPERLHDAIRWSLLGAGKRVRPALVIAAGRAFGAADERLIRTAAAIEMIHTFSLIHDDLPAMDDDDLRRGRLTCHKKFDEATAILAGDALLALAFRTIADDGGLDPATRIRLISVIADASATPNGMVAGQQLDLDAEGTGAGIADVQFIHERKTGALIAASCVAGAMIGGAAKDEIRSIDDFGRRLGLLFQIVDDLLDVTQPTGTLGKTAGKDAASSKATYPGSLGLDATRSLVDSTFADAIDVLTSLDRDTELLASIAKMIAGRTN
jgi:geranylgeranyl diphosphate synthase, type II